MVHPARADMESHVPRPAVDHDNHIAASQPELIRCMPVQDGVHHLELDKVIACAGCAQTGSADDLSAADEGRRRMPGVPGQLIEADASVELIRHPQAICMGPQAFRLEAVKKGQRPLIEQRLEGLRGRGHVAPVLEKDVLEPAQQLTLIRRQLRKGQPGRHQAHAAVDVGAYRCRDHDISGRGDDRADRGDGARMEVRCRACGAYGGIAAGGLDRGKVQQLLDRLFLQRQRGRQEDGGLGAFIADGVHTVRIAQVDMGASKGAPQSGLVRHDAVHSGPEKRPEPG